MTKYLAVIMDSFREAFASRVLWLVLVAITLLLVAVAPLSYREVVTTQFIDRDIRRIDDFMIFLRSEEKRRDNLPAQRIWERLTDKTRSRLSNVKIQGKDQEPGNPFEFISLISVLRKELNSQLKQADFYDAAVWKGITISSREANDLLKRHEAKDADTESLSPTEIARLNRLMIEAAFPEFIRVSPPTSAQFVYAWMDAGSPQPLSGNQIQESLQSSAATVTNFFVGAIGVFVAILVTAPIIPQMFDAGSLHLLLSKPISRPLLFLSKYLGGCAFILIAAAYLIGGLWLILGVRFSVWEPKILASIPIYLFVFAIYYAVSSLAAVVWRSAIVSVAVSILFWLACFVIGWAKVGMENMVLNKERFTRVFHAKDTLFGVDEFGWAYEYDETQSEWNDVFVLSEQRQARPFLLIAPTVPREFRTVGPVYDASNDRLVAAVPAFPPTSMHLCVGVRDEEWEPLTKYSAPTGTLGIFREPAGKLLFASSFGLSRLTGDPLATREPIKLFGMSLPLPSGGPFQQVNPDPAVLITQPADVAMNPLTGSLVIYTRGTLMRLDPERNKFVRKAEQKLDGEDRQAAAVAFGGERIVLGRDDGRVQLLDAATLETIHEFRPEGRNPPRFLEVSRDGHWATALFHTGNLWLYDEQTRNFTRPKVAGQGSISAANFDTDGSLMVVDHYRRVSIYSLDPLKLEKRVSPNLGVLVTGYRYGLLPLYTLFPKPGELDKTFSYLLSGKTTEKADDGDDDLATAQWNIDPWIPVWSSAAFTLVVLLAACVYIEFQEF